MSTASIPKRGRPSRARRALGRVAPVAAWLGTGCGWLRDDPAPPQRGVDVGTEIMLEVGRIPDVIGLNLLLTIVLAVGLVILLRRTLRLLVQITWRLGWDTDRRLARARSYTELAVLALAVLLVARKLLWPAPLLTSLTLALVGLIAALALPGGLQDLAAGIALAGRRRFLEGDQIEVGAHSGTVRHIGLVRTMLRLSNGRSLWLPNREVIRSAVQVGREQQALPISIDLPPGADDPDRRERLRRVAHLSPYRRAGSQPAVAREGDRWRLTFQTWCTRHPALAARAIERQLRQTAARWAEAERATEPEPEPENENETENEAENEAAGEAVPS